MASTKSLPEEFDFSGKTPLLGPLRRLMQTLEARFRAVEALDPQVRLAIESLLAVGLDRLEETFTPLILDAEQRLANIGALFSAESISNIEVGTGPKTFILTDETGEGWVFSDYVAIRESVGGEAGMVGRFVSYHRPTRVLDVDVVFAEGTGTFNAWRIGIGAPPDVTHATRVDNPHQVTAAQVGAMEAPAVDAAIAAAILSLSNAINIANYYNKTQVDLLIASAQPVDTEIELTAATTINWNMTAARNARVTLNQAGHTMALPTNRRVGPIHLKLIQGPGGAKTVTTWAGWKFPDNLPPVLSPNAGQVDLITGYCDGTNIIATWLNNIPA